MLRLEAVIKRFGNITAVDGLTLEVRTGEVMGLLGPNGAGKTTTISMMVGLLTPDSGQVHIGTKASMRSPSEPAARSMLGIAPQSLALYDELSARENLAFFGSLYGLKGAALKNRVEAVLALAELTDRGDDRVTTFSGGMKRRLNMGAALLHEPAIVLLDEPTAGVDPQSRSKLFDIVKQLKAAGKTVVYSTHYMEEAERMCDRVAIIDKGRLLALDTVAGLIGTYGGTSGLELVRAGGVEHIETSDPIGELTRCVNAGGVMSARINGPTLESVFLTLTGRNLRD